MNRRSFIFLGAGTITSCLCANESEKKWRILQSVQNHIFPKNGSFPSAEEFSSIRYLKIVSSHPSFDKDDLRFIFDGVDEIVRVGWKNTLAKDEKEKIMMNFSKTTFGKNWISTVLNYTLEALLSDPLYGGNVAQKGWRSLDHKAGIPRPTVRFAKLP